MVLILELLYRNNYTHIDNCDAEVVFDYIKKKTKNEKEIIDIKLFKHGSIEDTIARDLHSKYHRLDNDEFKGLFVYVMLDNFFINDIGNANESIGGFIKYLEA